MEDSIGVDKYMSKVAKAIRKYHKQPSDEFTDIYNRAWEAVYHALQDVATLTNPCSRPDSRDDCAWYGGDCGSGEKCSDECYEPSGD